MPPEFKSLTTRYAHVADWERSQKPRVWKRQGRLLLIALLALISYAALPATLYFTARLMLEQDPDWEKPALGSLIALVLSLIIGTVLSAMTKCALCHGSPLLGKNCRKHTLANKIPFLTYRASALLHVLFTGKFRCMFCSTPFRLGTKTENNPSSGSLR